MVDAFVSFAIQKLGDFLIQEVSLRLSLREDVQWLRNELLFMQSFLKDAEEKQSEYQRVQQWVFEINSVANDAVATLETYNFEADNGGDDGFASCLKAGACICRKETKFYKVVLLLEVELLDSEGAVGTDGAIVEPGDAVACLQRVRSGLAPQAFAKSKA
ncbi:putative disease resistance protein At1g50180 [Lycium barbarum]|uniref:putative disease resistance protein At1g50180 n=1 Tax=Lycium barbarum TaxID=112863 RepID=UPI00293EAC40|nr:putative disease resistance protein At1g50180 [Lycium barbarum]